MLLPQVKGGKLVVLGTLAIGCFLVLHLLDGIPSLPRWREQAVPLTQNGISTAAGELQNGQMLPCQTLHGGEDVVVVMRTGATEIKDKLTVHFDTTFKCYPNLVIFSDYEEEIRGYKVHDVLKNIDDEIKLHNRDFEHYQHVLKVGREGLKDSELSGKISWESGPVGKNDNTGWVLDKWKFLPMLNSTLELYPDKKWYIFIEPDTYLVWSNLLQWLSKLNPSTPYYFGSEVMIGEDVFAHGGSAFLLSRPAVEKGAESYRSKTQDWHEFTGGHWAGDCVLGRALHDAGVELTWSWPMFQGGNPSLMSWNETKPDDKILWCQPALSYHHLSPYEKLQLFHFEQNWLRAKQSRKTGSPESGLPFAFWRNTEDPILHHRDVFKLFVQPNLTKERKDWNNSPEISHLDVPNASLADCQGLCETDPHCMQYAVTPNGCETGMEMKLGRKENGVQSGWMMERIEKWAEELDAGCRGKTGWTVP